MARIDSLLAIVNQQSANELRMGTDREPKMLAYGAVKRLSIPTTPEDTLRDLLGEILTPEREQAMRAKGRIEVTYEVAGIGAFQVTLAARDGGFDVFFMRSARGGARTAPAEAARPAVAAPAPVVPPAPASSSGVLVAAPPHPVVAARAAPDDDADGAPLLASYVVSAAALRASDLHLADGEPPCVRVDGGLQRLELAAGVDVATTLGLGDAERAHLARGASIDMGRDVPGVGRVRIHVFQSSEGLAAAVRLLPRAAPIRATE